MSNTTRFSKLLCYILRHSPGDYDVRLDEGGWTNIEVLISRLKEREIEATIDLVTQTVAEDGKQRFAIQGGMIRANQGHSVKVDLQLEMLDPPILLLHGTATRFMDSIKTLGLIKGTRHHVHLTENKQTAIDTGSRYGKPVLLMIDTGKMHARGFKFWKSVNDVWLTKTVPPQYITVVDDD